MTENERAEAAILQLRAEADAAYSVGFEQCRRRAVQAEAEVEHLQDRIDAALAYVAEVDEENSRAEQVRLLSTTRIKALLGGRK